MAEQTLNHAEEMPGDLSSPKRQASFNPAKLNLQRMQHLQQIFKYGAAIVFIIFLVLIFFSYRELDDIKTEIRSQKNQILANDIKIDSQNNIIKARFVTIANFYKYADSVEKSKNTSTEITIVDKVEDIASQNKNPAEILPRVYLHIAREDQRAHAAAVAKLLEANGFIVPGIQRVRFQESSSLKCFETTGITKADTTSILKVLRDAAKINIRSYRLPTSEKIRPRHYEVWFGQNFDSDFK